ncbi:DUF3787 domain-containing protein [Desulfosporosinus fructosivorans]|uniref:DUF3787 domain-containing protein n=1 Tax=Desulfosporosinus fructosivorans TaxID=2018669 RepID=A0A4Z0R1H6_9FIRM|nr:DUF3787 domain-containing protein [Desulfosporosinus fructosivorans]TGE36922.1 DUF3787 domain-containing protein [Desulfosporosinus fructosivorans]
MNDKNKEHPRLRPIEQHTTAAWANIEKLKEISNVSIPSDVQVGNAKEWVDSNQK